MDNLQNKTVEELIDLIKSAYNMDMNMSNFQHERTVDAVAAVLQELKRRQTPHNLMFPKI